MTVAELIAALQQHHPAALVIVSDESYYYPLAALTPMQVWQIPDQPGHYMHRAPRLAPDVEPTSALYIDMNP